MNRTSRLEADLATAPIVNGVAVTAVAVPPSSFDGVPYRMRIGVHNAIITRPFDPELDFSPASTGTYGSYETGY